MAVQEYAHLLSAGRIGKLALRNRIIVTAMGVNLAEPDGSCGERMLAYHEEQARGGAALVNTGTAGVAWPVGGNMPNQVAISDDRFIPGLAAVADAVHAHGARFSVQLHHGGPVAMQDMLAGRPVWVPSLPAMPTRDFTQAFLLDELAAAPFSKIGAFTYQVMTREDIALVVRQFAAAAVRAQRAGADGVEIHGGHGYLLSAFVSPKSNKREDEYGGSLENRTRFLMETIRAVRAAVGPDFAVWCKIDACERGVDNGITEADAQATARMAQEAGADAITVTAYHDASQGKLHSGSHTPQEPGINLPAAAAIRAVLDIPVIASGRVDPEVGDAHIADGSVDFIAMGRKLLADPGLPNKLAGGRAADVLPCIYCYTCISAIYTGDPVRCAVNPRTGFEYVVAPPRSSARRRVVVVGGGPGGMEAARRLAEAGQQVILLERGNRLGGTLQFAALGYAANERMLTWLRRQVDLLGIEVRLDTEATPALVRSLAPQAVVVATGAVRELPSLPGADRAHVLSGDDMRALILGEDSAALKRKVGWAARMATRLGAATGVSANLDMVRKASHQWMPLGKRIVIVGGELVGLELAEFLAERGRSVSVVDDCARLGAGLTVVRRMRLLQELDEHGVGLHAAASGIRIDSDAVRFLDKRKAERALEADHVIVAKGARGELGLAEALRAEGLAVHTVGDCAGVAYIEGAMRGAANAAGAILAG